MAIQRNISCGAWSSPLSAASIAAATLRLQDCAVDAGESIWLEGRPADGGRNVLVRASDPDVDLIPAPFNVRSRVHEYGGGAFAVRDRRIWFVNDADQRIYTIAPGGSPVAVTVRDPATRYADLLPDPARRRLIAVRERHSDTGVANDLVAIRLADGDVEVLAGGHDFVASPALDARGERLAWLTWEHPDMPWDATTVWTARVNAAGRLADVTAVPAVGSVSAFQPAYGADGSLYVVADPEGWWNLCQVTATGLRPVLEMLAEFATPQWQFGMSTYGFTGNGDVIAAYCEHAEWRMLRWRPGTGIIHRFDLEFTDVSALRVAGEQALFIGASPRRPACVVSLDCNSGQVRIVRTSRRIDYPPENISAPEARSFPTTDGEVAHAFFYPPANAEYAPPAAERPPLIVIGHGGPTGASPPVYRPAVQFWTTRGFAVLDVNYRGSTGYGRAYREALYGRWGDADVADCVAGARALVDAEEVDPRRLIIRGSSAGGFTALAAITFHETFRAAASYYGISDLTGLASDTHKFESRYLDRLVGPYPAARSIYEQRSPLNHVGAINCPVIFFQGLEDKVVPPPQARAMVAALRERGLPVAYIEFPGEQHGFRRAETIERTLHAELQFYGSIFGFTPPGPPQDLVIYNEKPDCA